MICYSQKIYFPPIFFSSLFSSFLFLPFLQTLWLFPPPPPGGGNTEQYTGLSNSNCDRTPLTQTRWRCNEAVWIDHQKSENCSQVSDATRQEDRRNHSLQSTQSVGNYLLYGAHQTDPDFRQRRRPSRHFRRSLRAVDARRRAIFQRRFIAWLAESDDDALRLELLQRSGIVRSVWRET